MKLKYQLRKGSTVHVSSSKQYAELTPTKKGLEIYFTDCPTKRNSFLQQRDLILDTTHLPRRIINTYNWKTNQMIETEPLRKNTILLVGKLQGQIPEPMDFSELVSFPAIYDPEQAAKIDTILLEKRKIYLPFEENVVVSLHWGSQLFGEIKPERTSQYKNLLILKQEYGGNLQAYPFQDIAYSVPAIQKAIEIPTIWLQNAGLEDGSTIRLLKMPDGTILFSPEKTVCDFCGKILDPIVTRPHKEPVCKKLLQFDKKIRVMFTCFGKNRRSQVN